MKEERERVGRNKIGGRGDAGRRREGDAGRRREGDAGRLVSGVWSGSLWLTSH